MKSQSKDFLHKLADNYVNSRKNARAFETSVFGNFLYNQSTLENKPDSTLFLATLYLQCNDYENAYLQLKKFAEGLDKTEDAEMRPYFNCCLQYLKLKKDNLTEKAIALKLNVIFEKEMVKEVMADISADDQLQYYDLPTCPHCEHCPVAETCYYVDAMRIAKSIQNNIEMHNQTDMVKFLNNIQ